jgi:dTMP kinase
MFISFEGLDYSGKSTQASLLADRLRREGRTVLLLREPGGTRIGERVRDVLLDPSLDEMSDEAELLLFSASRSQLVHEVILPALRRGEAVITDRFHDSTTAYQGYGRGLDPGAVAHINAVATRGVLPDLTLLVEVTVEEIGRRLRAAGKSADRLERSGWEFYERVRRGYAALAEAEPERFVRINGMAPPQKVEQDIRAAVETLVRRAGNLTDLSRKGAG